MTSDSPITADSCLVLDLGSPHAQLLAGSARKLGVHTRIEPGTISAERITSLNPRAIILACCHPSEHRPVPAVVSDHLLRAGLPVLAVCDSSLLTAGPGWPDTCLTTPHDAAVRDVLGDFLFGVAQFTATWTMAHFLEEAVPRLRAQVGDGHVVLGLSGGVDSMVTAALLHRAVGEQLTCVLVDNGFLRAGEREAVEATSRKLIPGRLRVVDARQTFVNALAGAAPDQKRRIIRAEFRSVFEQQAAQIPNATFLAQGIIYSDLIGTAPAHDPAVPRAATLEPIQPLRELFKDEVRELGALLGLPHNLIRRQPSPGPGLAVRCVGQVTQPRLDILRAADHILNQEIERANLSRPAFQSFAVLLPVPSVTGTGGHSPTGETICLRVVESDDGATANWIPLPATLLNTISARLMTQVPGISRVVYDITSKPPGRIEWE